MSLLNLSYSYKVCINCYIFVDDGEIETNPGPKKNCPTRFLLRHWNLNSLLASKIPHYRRTTIFVNVMLHEDI